MLKVRFVYSNYQEQFNNSHSYRSCLITILLFSYFPFLSLCVRPRHPPLTRACMENQPRQRRPSRRGLTHRRRMRPLIRTLRPRRSRSLIRLWLDDLHIYDFVLKFSFPPQIHSYCYRLLLLLLTSSAVVVAVWFVKRSGTNQILPRVTSRRRRRRRRRHVTIFWCEIACVRACVYVCERMEDVASVAVSAERLTSFTKYNKWNKTPLRV